MNIRWLIGGLLLGCSMMFAVPTATRADDEEVFIVAGQSNADGRGQAADLKGPLAKYAKPQKDVLIAYACSAMRGEALDSGGFKPLQPGWSVAPGNNRPEKLPSKTFGPEVSFGRTLADAMPGKHVILIKFCEGGTSLKKDWDPDKESSLYHQMLAFYRDRLKERNEAGHTCHLRGMIWHQGEADAALKQGEYQKLLTAFIERTRKDLETPDLPFGIGEVFDNQKRDHVREGQKATALAVPNTYFATAEGLKTSDNGTHFDAASQIEMGKRLAEGMIKLVQGKPKKSPAGKTK